VDSDWREAFGYAGEEESLGTPNVSPVPGSQVSAAPFGRTDVVLLLGLATGERDGAQWVYAGRLRDGRWFCLRAGCDNTGWDCHANGHASVALSLRGLLRLGMSPEERHRCSRPGLDLEALVHADDETIQREIVVLLLGSRSD
jgi:hypothetical protein